jgi:hypothetical protein
MSRIRGTLAYRRVSTREQGVAGTSLDAQRTEIERYCAAHGLPDPIDHVEVESGGEESEEKRSEVMRLLASVRAGDAVLVSKIDLQRFPEMTRVCLSKMVHLDPPSSRWSWSARARQGFARYARRLRRP